MGARIRIKWSLPADLANVQSTLLYRMLDPGEDKTCDDLIAEGSLILEDNNSPFQSQYIDEIDDAAKYRYGAFVKSHAGDLSECDTFVYNYQGQNVKVKLTAINTEAAPDFNNLDQFGTLVQEAGATKQYEQEFPLDTVLNINDFVNYENGLVPLKIIEDSIGTATILDKQSSGFPDTEITLDDTDHTVNITVEFGTDEFTVEVKGDTDFFSQNTKKYTGQTLFKKTISSGKTEKITVKIKKDKKNQFEFDKYEPEDPDRDPYGQDEYDPLDRITKVRADSDFVLIANYKEKSYTLRLTSDNENIGSVSGAGEYTSSEEIVIIATPLEPQTKFKRWQITRGENKISAGDPTIVSEGNVSTDAIIYDQLKIEGNVNLKAFFTKVFLLILKNMGPNGLEGSSSRGSISIDANDQFTDGNTIRANIESLDNPFTISATPASNHRFDGWQLINGNIDNLSTQEITVNSDAEIHAVFTREYVVTITIFSKGSSDPSKQIDFVSIENVYDEINNNVSLEYDDYEPQGKYEFEKWVLDSTDITATSVSSEISDDIDLEIYVLEVYTLSLSVNIEGAATLSGAGNYAFQSHENIDISATISTPTTAPAYQFLNWTSDQSLTLPTSETGQVTIVEDTQITANIEKINYVLTIGSNDTSKGTVSQSGAGSYDVFEEIEIFANPDGNNIFLKWTVISADFTLTDGDDFNLSEFQLGDYGNLELEAEFLQVFTLTIKVYKDGVEEPSLETTITRTEEDPLSVTATQTDVADAAYEFDTWQVESGNLTITDPGIAGDKSVDLSEDAVISINYLKANTIELLTNIPNSASFTHDGSDNLFRETEDINITLELNNTNLDIPLYAFNNNYIISDNTLVNGLDNNLLDNVINILGDVTITADLVYVLYSFSATTDINKGSIVGTTINGNYNGLEDITLQAEETDASRYVFKEWKEIGGQDRTIAAKSTIIKLSDYGDISLEAIFQVLYNYSVIIKYPDASQDEDVIYDTTILEGTTVNLDIAPSIQRGFRFREWETAVLSPDNVGFDPASADAVDLIINADTSLIASVDPVFMLELTINIAGAGSLAGSGGYLSTEDINIETAPFVGVDEVAGYQFDNWVISSGSISNAPDLTLSNITIRITEDTEIEAVYSIKEYSLTITSINTEGLVGINSQSKNNNVSGSFDITENITADHEAASGYKFSRFVVVSADQGISPGEVFTDFAGFNLSKYGNLELKAEFLKVFTFTTEVYKNNVLTSTDQAEVLESFYSSGVSETFNVAWPTPGNGLLIDSAETDTEFDVNDSSDQDITISSNGQIRFNFRDIEQYTLTINRITDGGSSTSDQVVSFDEVNNIVTIPSIIIPAGFLFETWTVTSGNVSATFDALTKDLWPEGETPTFSENIVLTYEIRTIQQYTLTINKIVDDGSSEQDQVVDFDEVNNIVTIPSIIIPAGFLFETWTVTSGNVSATFDALTKDLWPEGETPTFSENIVLTYEIRTVEEYVLTIKKQLDNLTPLEDSVITVNEVNNTLTIPPLSIPTSQVFQSWEVVSGNVPSNFASLSKDLWPESEGLALTGDVELKYIVFGAYSLSITAKYPTSYPDTAPRFASSHALSTDSANNGPYFIEDVISISVVIPSHLGFTEWSIVSGGLIGPLPTSANGNITISGDTEIQIEFDYTLYSFSCLNLSNGSIAGTTSSGSYNAFTDITITATPNEHFKFDKWQEQLSTGVWVDFNAAQNDTINLTKDLKLKPVYSDILYALSISIFDINGVEIIDGSHGSFNGSGAYIYEAIEEIEAITNPGHKFVRWEVHSGVTPGFFDASDQVQTIKILGHVSLHLIIEKIPLPVDGSGNRIIPLVIPNSDANHNEWRIDRDMIAVSSDAKVIVATVDCEHSPGGFFMALSLNSQNEYIQTMIKLQTVSRIQGEIKKSNFNSFTTGLVSRYFHAGYIRYRVSSRSEIEEYRIPPMNLVISRDGKKFGYSNPDTLYTASLTNHLSTTTYSNYNVPIIEFGSLSLDEQGNIESFKDDKSAGESNLTFDLSLEGSSWSNLIGGSISYSDNFMAVSMPLFHEGKNYFGGRNSESAYLMPTENLKNPAHIDELWLARLQIRDGNVPQKFYPENFFTPTINPWIVSNDQGIGIPMDSIIMGISHGENILNYQTTSSFGQSIDICKNSPKLEESSVDNPIFLAITSRYMPSSDDDQLWFSEEEVHWDTEYSVTKILGIYKEGEKIYKYGINGADINSPINKTPTTAIDKEQYKGSWQFVDCNVDKERIIDYKIVSELESKTEYGTKVRLSENGDRCVITNHRDPDSQVADSNQDKPGEVKVFTRRNITIEYKGNQENWFEYNNTQNITIPEDHNVTGDGWYDFGYDISFEGDFLAISSPSENTVFIYKWQIDQTGSFIYWNKIHMEEPEVLGKAVVFDPVDPGTITISADSSFFTLPIPDKL